MGPRRPTSAVVLPDLASLVGACGGSATTPPGGAAALGRAVGARPSVGPARTRVRRPMPATPAPTATIEYSIWGDPAEITNQQAVVDAFQAANPKITSR